ncbi:MAG: hypothetical protein ACE5J9_08140 [Methanosarcinales archaeon]
MKRISNENWLELENDLVRKKREVIEQWISATWVPKPEKVPFPPDIDLIEIEDSKWHFDEKTKKCKCEFEYNESVRSLLKNYIPIEFIKKWKEYEQKVCSYLYKCYDLYKKICEESTKETKLPLCQDELGEDDPQKNECITEYFNKIVYKNLFDIAEGRYNSIRSKIKEDGLWFGGDRRIVRGNKEEVLNSCNKIHEEMMSKSYYDKYSVKISEILNLKKEIDQLEKVITEKLETLKDRMSARIDQLIADQKLVV